MESKGGGPHGDRPPDPQKSYAFMARGPKPILRKFSMMREAAKKERNVIEIRFQKQRVNGDSGRQNKYVDLETISEYCFSELGLKPDMIEAIDLNTGRFETKQIKLKQGVDASKYVNDFPDTYGDYVVSITNASKLESTKVTFKNVPLEIQDDELMNLCVIYGKVDGEIKREAVNMNHSKYGKFKLTSSTRYVYMKLNPGQKFKNYYWMEGPLPGDQGRRITVLHYGQLQ